MVILGGSSESRELLRKKLLEEFGQRAKDTLWATLEVSEVGGGPRRAHTPPEYETRDYVIPPNCRVIDDEISFIDRVLFIRRLPIAFRSNVHEAVNIQKRIVAIREHLRILNHIYRLCGKRESEEDGEMSKTGKPPHSESTTNQLVADNTTEVTQRLMRNIYNDLKLPQTDEGGLAYLTRSCDKIQVLPSSMGEARIMSDLATLERLGERIEELELETRSEEGARIEMFGTCRNLVRFLDLIEDPKRLGVVGKTFSNLQFVQHSKVEEGEGEGSHMAAVSKKLVDELQCEENRRIEALYAHAEHAMGVVTTEDWGPLKDTITDNAVAQVAELVRHLAVLEDAMADVAMQSRETEKMIGKMETALEEQHACLGYLLGKCAGS